MPRLKLDPDEEFMRMALREAARGVGRTSPNPPVGAILVRGKRVIGRGWHRGAGLPHAEVEALRAARAAGEKVAGATLYVTLEPCSTQGRTPPCCDAILAAGIRRVVVGATDPDPRHAGRGFEILRCRGVEVRDAVLEPECCQIIRPFAKRVSTRMPWVIAKAGQTVDGRLTRRREEGRWITSESARKDAMRLRARVDAILVGAGTVREDDPSLDVRGVRVKRQPLRVVWSPTGALPNRLKLLSGEDRLRTRICSQRTLRGVLKHLARMEGINAVLIEGGGRTLGAAFDEGVVDEVALYTAPLLTGGPVPTVGGRGAGSVAGAFRLTEVKWKKCGPDLVLSGLTEAGAKI